MSSIPQNHSDEKDLVDCVQRLPEYLRNALHPEVAIA